MQHSKFRLGDSVIYETEVDPEINQPHYIPGKVTGILPNGRIILRNETGSELIVDEKNCFREISN